MKSAHIKFFAAAALTLLFSIGALAQTEREKGIEFYDAGDYTSAIDTLEKAVAADKTDGIAWRFLAMSYAQSGEKAKRKKAVGAFREAFKFPDTDLNNKYDKPVNISKKSPARYTDAARQNNVSGKVVLFVEFGRNGKVGNIYVFRKLPDGLTENAVKTAREIEFSPAIKDGKAVTNIKLIEYAFEIY